MRKEQESLSREDQINNVGDIWTQTNRTDENMMWDIINSTIGFNYQLSENHSLGMQYDISGYLNYSYDDIVSNNVFLNGDYYDKLNNQSHSSYSNHLTHYLNGYYNGKVEDLI